MAQVPWDGPQVRVVEHNAHAPGHAALLIEERGGTRRPATCFSDVLIPMLDLNHSADPEKTTSPRCGWSRAWRAASMSSSPDTGLSAELIGHTHGSTRIGRTCTLCVTPMFSATRGPAPRRTARIGCLGVHERQLQRLARSSERDGTPG